MVEKPREVMSDKKSRSFVGEMGRKEIGITHRNLNGCKKRLIPISLSIFSKLTPKADLKSPGYELFRTPSQVTLDQILAEI
jgi:hypothetical protein